jgi:hypothetical protein
MVMSLGIGIAIVYFGGTWGGIYVLLGALGTVGYWLLWHRPMLALGSEELRKLFAAGEVPLPELSAEWERELLWIWQQQTFNMTFNGLYLAPVPVLAFLVYAAHRVAGTNMEPVLRDRAGHYLRRMLSDPNVFDVARHRILTRQSVG